MQTEENPQFHFYEMQSNEDKETTMHGRTVLLVINIAQVIMLYVATAETSSVDFDKRC